MAAWMIEIFLLSAHTKGNFQIDQLIIKMNNTENVFLNDLAPLPYCNELQMN